MLGQWLHKAPNEWLTTGTGHSAAHTVDFTLIWRLLQTGLSLDTADADGRTPLYYADQGGHVEVVRLLLSSSSEINRADVDGSTPMHAAAGAGHLQVVVLLMDDGCGMDLPDKSGATPLLNAAE